MHNTSESEWPNGQTAEQALARLDAELAKQHPNSRATYVSYYMCGLRYPVLKTVRHVQENHPEVFDMLRGLKSASETFQNLFLILTGDEHEESGVDYEQEPLTAVTIQAA